MPLFEFELARVEDIEPWGEPRDAKLNWFALTDGSFRVVAGREILFQYTEEILDHWKSRARDAEYQVATFARDILSSVAPGVAKLPRAIEELASDWELLARLRQQSNDNDDEEARKSACSAWRWLGERSPWTSYLAACPEIQFVRIGDDLHIRWDNRERVIDGLPVWTAQYGVHVLPVGAFLDECRDFATRLLAAMDARIAAIESGTVRPQIEVDISLLRQQQVGWRDEFSSYFKDYEPEIPWDEAEAALRAIAGKTSRTRLSDPDIR